MARRSSAAATAQALDAVLRGLFRALEARPTPAVFRIVLAQLCEAAPERAPAREGVSAAD